ncbi:MAG: hypothetical protein ACLP07_16250 [Terracidiphilus sp.]
MGPRSWKRREFAVTQAGYFTVLKPTGGFSATLQPGSRYLNDLSKDGAVPPPAPGQAAPDRSGTPETTIHLQTVSPGPGELHWVRLALIVLTAAVLTLSVLWWMTPNNPWHDLGR